jgi:hypothetical protein
MQPGWYETCKYANLYLLMGEDGKNIGWARTIHASEHPPTHELWQWAPHQRDKLFFSDLPRLKSNRPTVEERPRSFLGSQNSHVMECLDAVKRGEYNYDGVPLLVFKLSSLPAEKREEILQHFCFYCAQLTPCNC